MSSKDKIDFSGKQQRLLIELLSSVSNEQAKWLSAFLAENAAEKKFGEGDSSSNSLNIPLLILYGSESGNSENLADKAKKLAAQKGFKPVVKDMFETKPEDLISVKNLLVVVATWGEGDPPERAVEFFKSIKSDSAPKLSAQTNFAVLALGDTSYVDFCQAGKDIDSRLETLGAKRIFDRVDCDVDFEKQAMNFLENSLNKFLEVNGVDISKIKAVPAKSKTLDLHAIFGGESEYNQSNPYIAEVKEKVLLNDVGSQKETYHLEINLEGSGIRYAAGDALGVIPLNDNAIVELLIKTANFNGDEIIEGKKLKHLISEEYDITTITKPVLEAYSKLSGDKKLAEIISGDFAKYIYGRDVVDLIYEFPVKNLKAADLLGVLRKLPHRLYSIASAQDFVGEEVHLTTATVRYEVNGRKRKGVASGFVADDLKAGSKVKIFPKPNKNFRLPENNNIPIIMVGPGTGVAPFRAFVQQRDAEKAKGKNWLFFGEQHYLHDFFYQLEWQEFKEKGILTNFDAAFSRDQPEKIYVQNRMWEKRGELFEWLEQGAYFYVCGDESRMAKDVDKMLHDIIADASGKGDQFAKEYVSKMKSDKRYLRDVY